MLVISETLSKKHLNTALQVKAHRVQQSCSEHNQNIKQNESNDTVNIAHTQSCPYKTTVVITRHQKHHTKINKDIFFLEHKTGIDLTVSSTLKKPSKNYTVLFRDVSDYS